jgi:type IV pilus assembly protein PilC
MTLNRKEWTIFSFQASMLLQQNFLLQDVLDIISRSRTRKKVKQLSQELRKETEKGFSLKESLLRACPGIEPFYLLSISAGEQSGTLTNAFQNLYHHLERKNTLEQRLKSTSAYPLIILSISIILGISLLSFIVPLIQEIASSIDMELPTNTRRLIATSQWISTNRYYLGIAVLLLIAGVFYLRQRFRYFFHTFCLKLPFIGDWTRKKELWKFFSTFSLLLSNQVTADTALAIACETLHNVRLSEEIALAMEPLRQGESLSGSLHRFMISSEYLYSLLKTGEESNRMAQNAQFISEALQGELNASYDQWVKLAEPALFLLIGMVVLWIVFSAYLPMLSMFQWDTWNLP